MIKCAPLQIHFSVQTDNKSLISFLKLKFAIFKTIYQPMKSYNVNLVLKKGANQIFKNLIISLLLHKTI